jgi:hypothetical protein
MYIVYQHVRLDTNEIFYIGIGKSKKRAFFKNNRNKHWQNIVNKVDYKVEILHDNISSWELTCTIEIYLIHLYGRKDLGLGTLVNMTDGGEGLLNSKHNLGKKHSNETKMKMSIKAKQRHPLSKEHMEKLKLSRIGSVPTNRKKILQYDKSNNLIQEYLFIEDAAFCNKILGTSINNNLNGRSKSAGGYIWKYKKN